MAQINKPNTHFNTLLYTGDGATSTAGTTARTLTGVGFQPDLTWVKERSNTEQHFLQDAVRGASKVLASNTTTAEADVLTNYTDGGINGFVSDGFTLGSGTAGNANNINTNTETYVAWNWLASNTTASNTDGSITSTVSANTTSGFSIVSYTGTGANATIGHGLGVAPKFIIIKVRNADRYWAVQTSTGAGFEMNLNVTEAQTATSVYWNSTDPTSSVFSVGTNAATNLSGDDYIAYVFAPIKGFSKMGSYTGNGNADGPFVYTGFKPAFIMIKKTDSATQNESWYIFDNKRSTFNPTDDALRANLSNAEISDWSAFIEFLSNGVKIRNSDPSTNVDGSVYVYMAFAENPLVGTNNIPATAR